MPAWAGETDARQVKCSVQRLMQGSNGRWSPTCWLPALQAGANCDELTMPCLGHWRRSLAASVRDRATCPSRNLNGVVPLRRQAAARSLPSGAVLLRRQFCRASRVSDSRRVHPSVPSCHAQRARTQRVRCDPVYRARTHRARLGGCIERAIGQLLEA